MTISGLSKTFSCTGWRLGYVIAPEAETRAIRKVHDFLTVGAPEPLQAAGAVGLIALPTPKSMDVPWERQMQNAGQPGPRLSDRAQA